MMKHFVRSILVLILFSTGLFAVEEQKSAVAQDASKEDLKVIEVLDILELMEVVVQMELFQDMNLIVEGKGDEKKK